MSFLEDVFLQDEAGEAQELERVIEGDEFDERPRSPDSDDNSEKEDEAAEDKRRVDPQAKAKRVVKNPRFILNPARLTGPRGIQVIPDHFKDFKFKGRGHEKEDLDLVLKKLEHWAYRLYPKFKFEDCLKKMETLGKKRPVMVHLHKIRTDQFLSEETVVQRDSSDEEPAVQEEDEFDKLLQQQIELARATPAPGSVRKAGFMTPAVDKRSPLTMPKATSSPSISDDQRDRMIRNRQLAEERRLARLTQANDTNGQTDNDLAGRTDSNSKQQSDVIDLVDINNDTRLVSKQNVIDLVGADKSRPEKESDADTVDLVDDPNELRSVLTDAVKVVDLVGEHNSGSDVENTVNTVDLLDTDSSEATQVKDTRRRRLLDSSDDEDMNVKQDVVVDVFTQNNEIGVSGHPIIAMDEEVFSTKRLNKSNDSDSSDDDCGVITVNQSVTVDIHNDKCNDSKKAYYHDDNTREGKAMDDTSTNLDNGSIDVDIDAIEVNSHDGQTNEVIVNLAEDVDKADVETKGDTDKIDKEIENSEFDKKTVDLVELNQENSIGCIGDDTGTDKNSNLPVNGEIDEDLMDVDFSDDF